ncbi:MAG: hypothetical protein AAB926_01805 [Patescibacteria group bacterium]
MNNTTITIPKELARSGNLVLIPQAEYEELLFKAKGEKIKTYKPSPAELKALERGRKEMQEGKYILWHELKEKLARGGYRRRGKKS